MTLAVEQEKDGLVTRERLQTDGAGCFLVDILNLPPPPPPPNVVLTRF